MTQENIYFSLYELKEKKKQKAEQVFKSPRIRYNLFRFCLLLVLHLTDN